MKKRGCYLIIVTCKWNPVWNWIVASNDDEDTLTLPKLQKSRNSRFNSWRNYETLAQKKRLPQSVKNNASRIKVRKECLEKCSGSSSSGLQCTIALFLTSFFAFTKREQQVKCERSSFFSVKGCKNSCESNGRGNGRSNGRGNWRLWCKRRAAVKREKWEVKGSVCSSSSVRSLFSFLSCNSCSYLESHQRDHDVTDVWMCEEGKETRLVWQ